jgi:hypothetical protein
MSPWGIGPDVTPQHSGDWHQAGHAKVTGRNHLLPMTNSSGGFTDLNEKSSATS